MPTKNTRPLSRDERDFLRQMYAVNKGAVLLKHKRLGPEGSAHLAAELTAADLHAYRLLTGDTQ